MPSPFIKGNKLGTGRPLGSKNKDTQNYLDCQLWFKTALNELSTLTKEENRLTLIISVIDRLMQKVQTLPSSPGDSVANAKDLMDVMKEIEGQVDSHTAA